MKRSPLSRKTPLRRTGIKRTSTKKKHTPGWYKKRVVERFMAAYRGQPCAICESTSRTCAHHILAKGSHPSHVVSPENIIVLCPTHHVFSNQLAPHSKNQLAVGRFNDWLEEHRPEQMAWCKEHEWDTIKRDWKAMYEGGGE